MTAAPRRVLTSSGSFTSRSAGASGELGVGAGKALGGYPVALTHAGDAGPNLDDRAAGLGARDEGGRTL